MVQDLLHELHRRGVRLRLDGSRLDVLAPPGTLTAELRAELRAQRDELIALLRTARAGGDLPQITPRPAERHEPFPLSDIQHAYWVGRNPALELGGVATHFYFELESEGLDVRRLGESLRRVIDRHDMLRSVVRQDGRQQILPEVPGYEMPVTDLRGHSSRQQAEELERIRTFLGHQVFPADQWPLFDIRASRLDDRRLLLHVSIDLLIADGFSLYLLFRDWRRFYAEPGWNPEPLALSYRDYVLAEEALRQDGAYRSAEEYWLSRVDALPPAPALPLATALSQVSRPEFTRRRACLPRAQWDRIKDHARRRGLTPSAVLLTAFADVLRRWSEQPAFTLNLSLFNRPPLHPRISEVIGDFTSVTLLAVETPPDAPFAVRAAQLHRQLMRDLEHLSYSGVRVLRERARRLGSGPAALMPVVFTSVLALSSDDDSADSMGFFGGTGFFGSFRYGISQTPQVALDHQVAEEQGDLYFNWDAVEPVFPAGLLDDLFTAYCRLLARLSEDGGGWDRAGQLVPLPQWQAAERRAANSTAAAIPARTLCGLATERAARQGEAVAVISHDGQFSYREVAEHAHRLARHLGRLGTGRGALVGVVMDRGREQVPAVLGITESGAAYVPIDPDWPEARRWELLDQSGVGVVVTTPRLRDELSWPAGVSPVTFADSALAGLEAAPPPGGPAPGDLAYVIFTSGSTGHPKGVMIDHRSAANTVQDLNARFQVGPGDRVLALSALSFDLSVYDIFGTLAAGATVIIPAPGLAHDPAHWAGLMEQHAVTIWNSVPALMQAWLDADGRPAPGRVSPLRLVLLSGDWIPVTQPDAIRAAHPGARVVSLGGATEAAIWSVWYPVGEVPAGWSRIPYGKPLAQQTLHVYNQWLEPSPVWTVGEIYIGGVGVARGYLGDPAKTAEHFIVHPETGERLYRTGDFGRYLPGGDIEFLGRADSQVKLNGHRIELGEIAAALRRQPGVRQALVNVAASPATGRRQLVAYVVPDGGLADSPAGPPEGTAAAWQSLVTAAGAERRELASRVPGELAAYRDLIQALNDICPPLVARTFARMGLFTTAGETATAAGVIGRCGIKPRYRPLVDQWLAMLAGTGLLVPDGPDGPDRAYRCGSALDAASLDRDVQQALAALGGHGAHRVLAGYFTNCAGSQIELLRGEVNVREFLLPDGGWEVTEAMYARNALAQLQNRVVAQTVRSFITGRGPGPAEILEVGAGTGATTEKILAVLPPGPGRYRFTDVSFFFTERAKRKFRAHPFIEYQVVDIDQDPAAQGVPPETADVVVAANVLHNAKDLGRTLRYLRSALRPDGLAVLVENTVNEPFHLVTVGFYQDIGNYHDGRVLPLVPPERWRELVRAAGFARFAALPDGHGDAIGQHILLAQAPAGRPRPDPAGLRAALEKLMPGYMVPAHCLLVEDIPLSANGKVDPDALPLPWTDTERGEPARPRGDLEARLLAIWQETLARGDFGVTDNFFELGGDSLHALRIISRLREETGLRADADEGLQLLFDHPTISALAAALPERTETPSP